MDRLPHWLDSILTSLGLTAFIAFGTVPWWGQVHLWVVFSILGVVFSLSFFLYFKLGQKEKESPKIEKTYITNEAHDPDEKNMLVDLQTAWPSPHGLGLTELFNFIATKEELAKRLATKEYYSIFAGFYMDAITKYRNMFFAWHKIQQGVDSSNGLSLEEFFNVQHADMSLSKNLALEAMRGTQMDYFLAPLKIIEERNAKFGNVNQQWVDDDLDRLVLELNYGT